MKQLLSRKACYGKFLYCFWAPNNMKVKKGWVTMYFGLRGHSQTTLTIFSYFLNTNLPPVDKVKEFHYCYQGKSAYCWHIQYHLPTSSCQHSLWTTPTCSHPRAMLLSPFVKRHLSGVFCYLMCIFCPLLKVMVDKGNKNSCKLRQRELNCLVLSG